MKKSVPKIVNVKYKNVIRPSDFAKNPLQIEMKQKIDFLCDVISSTPTGYFICVFGSDTNQGMARTYKFTEECPVGVWKAGDIIKNSI